MKQNFFITPKEIETIRQVIYDNQITEAFQLIHNSSSGIGSTLDMEYETEINGRDVHVRVPITGVESW